MRRVSRPEREHLAAIFSEIKKAKPTLALADLLGETIEEAGRRRKVRRPEVDELVSMLADTWQVTPAAVWGPSRRRPVAHARQDAWLILTRADVKARDVARMFDVFPGTVSKGVGKAEERLKNSSEAAARVAWMTSWFEAQRGKAVA